MVLSALRTSEEQLKIKNYDELNPESDSGTTDKEGHRIQSLQTDKGWFCADEDYETAEMIGNKMLLHIAAAYRMIDGDAQDVVPEIKPLDQRKVLFEQLKGEYSHGDLAKEAKRQGISKRTVERWNLNWIENGLVEKTNHGQYRKVA